MCWYGNEQQDAINTVMQEYRYFSNIQEPSQNTVWYAGAYAPAYQTVSYTE
jgi:hypothetical protein